VYLALHGGFVFRGRISGSLCIWEGGCRLWFRLISKPSIKPFPRLCTEHHEGSVRGSIQEPREKDDYSEGQEDRGGLGRHGTIGEAGDGADGRWEERDMDTEGGESTPSSCIHLSTIGSIFRENAMKWRMCRLEG